MSCFAKRKINFDFKCNSCSNLYNLNDLKPVIIAPCKTFKGHTVCFKCSTDLTKCPYCNAKSDATSQNWEISKRLSESNDLKDIEDFDCGLCVEEFDSEVNLPATLIPCGHSLCQKCARGLRHKLCPYCRTEYEQLVLNKQVISWIPKPIVPKFKKVRDRLNKFKTLVLTNYIEKKSSIYFTIFRFVFLAYMILYWLGFVLIGSILFDKCPKNNLVPIWFIVHGLFSILMTFQKLQFYLYCYLPIKVKHLIEKLFWLSLALFYTLIIFLICWFIIGLVWIIGVWNAKSTECQPILFIFFHALGWISLIITIFHHGLFFVPTIAYSVMKNYENRRILVSPTNTTNADLT